MIFNSKTYLVEKGITGDYEFNYTPTYDSMAMGTTFTSSDTRSIGQRRVDNFKWTYGDQAWTDLSNRDKLHMMSSGSFNWRRFWWRRRIARVRNWFIMNWWRLTGKWDKK